MLLQTVGYMSSGLCRENLETFAKDNEVSVICLPGHSSVLGDEIVKELARKGSRVELVAPMPGTSICGRRIGMLLRKKALEEYEVAWIQGVLSSPR